MADLSPHDVIHGRLAELSKLLKAQREQRGLTLRAAAEEIGTPFSTLSRTESGRSPDAANLLLIALWLDIPPSWFTGDGPDDPLAGYRRGWNDCAAAVRAATERNADA